MAKMKKVSDSYTAYAKGGTKLKKAEDGYSLVKKKTTSSGTKYKYKSGDGDYTMKFKYKPGQSSQKPTVTERRTLKGLLSGTSKAEGRMMKKGGSFPDLNKDGKVTQKDILIGKGVLPKTAKKGTVAMKKQAAVAIAMKKAGKAPKKKMMGGGMAKPVMKNGGKKAPKKMMGGGRCKYGC